MTRLHREMRQRMLGNGYCTRPETLDCTFESVCETCTFFQTSIEFRPTLQAQHDHAAAHRQTSRQNLFADLSRRRWHRQRRRSVPSDGGPGRVVGHSLAACPAHPASARRDESARSTPIKHTTGPDGKSASFNKYLWLRPTYEAAVRGTAEPASGRTVRSIDPVWVHDARPEDRINL